MAAGRAYASAAAPAGPQAGRRFTRDRQCDQIYGALWRRLANAAIHKRWPWLKHLFADGGYDRTQLMDKAALLSFVIEIVRRMEAQKGFEVLPRRWVVERTFAWMTRWRAPRP